MEPLALGPPLQQQLLVLGPLLLVLEPLLLVPAPLLLVPESRPLVALQ